MSGGEDRRTSARGTASLLCRGGSSAPLPSSQLRCSGVSSAVLVPADQSAGVPEDLLGEQDRSPGEGNGRGGGGDIVLLSFGGCPWGGVSSANAWPTLFVPPQINNMKAKFKETLERCDNLERRLNDIGKEKQGMEKK